MSSYCKGTGNRAKNVKRSFFFPPPRSMNSLVVLQYINLWKMVQSTLLPLRPMYCRVPVLCTGCSIVQRRSTLFYIQGWELLLQIRGVYTLYNPSPYPTPPCLQFYCFSIKSRLYFKNKYYFPMKKCEKFFWVTLMDWRTKFII